MGMEADDASLLSVRFGLGIAGLLSVDRSASSRIGTNFRNFRTVPRVLYRSGQASQSGLERSYTIMHPHGIPFRDTDRPVSAADWSEEQYCRKWISPTTLAAASLVVHSGPIPRRKTSRVP